MDRAEQERILVRRTTLFQVFRHLKGVQEALHQLEVEIHNTRVAIEDDLTKTS